MPDVGADVGAYVRIPLQSRAEGTSLHVDYEKLGPDAAELDKQSKYKKIM